MILLLGLFRVAAGPRLQATLNGTINTSVLYF